MAYEGFSADAALTTPIAGDHCQCSINPCGCKTKTTVAGYSVQGKRFENEDAVRCYETERLSVAVVADGIGERLTVASFQTWRSAASWTR